MRGYECVFRDVIHVVEVKMSARNGSLGAESLTKISEDRGLLRAYVLKEAYVDGFDA